MRLLRKEDSKCGEEQPQADGQQRSERCMEVRYCIGTNCQMRHAEGGVAQGAVRSQLRAREQGEDEGAEQVRKGQS